MQWFLCEVLYCHQCHEWCFTMRKAERGDTVAAVGGVVVQ